MTAGLLDRERLVRVADGLAAAVAVALPWSPSATSILLVLWLVVVLPTLSVASVWRELMTPAGGLPVLLWALGSVGMLWADTSWSESLSAHGGFHKLLVIPALLAHFRRSGRGGWVILGFLVSSAVLLAVSWGLAIIPGLSWRGRSHVGVVARDYIAQSGIFAICALGLLGQGIELWRSRRTAVAVVVVLAAAAFIANLVYVSTSRTTLAVVAILFLLLGYRQFRWRGLLAAGLLGSIVGGLVWMSSPYVRDRVTHVVEEARNYQGSQALWSSAGARIQFWIKSTEFVADAPVIGHGTGMIGLLFRRSAVAEPETPGLVTDNPHNQVVAVAVQLGLVGTIALIAMWVAHFSLFRGATLASWLGAVIVVQNVMSSFFHSHLTDFVHGWIYVLGVGVLGGMVLGQRQRGMTVDPGDVSTGACREVAPNRGEVR